MEYIERKTMLYKTGVEYGDYTINHVLGCAHGCKYPCYAYLMAKRFGKVKSYEEWLEPKIVSNSLELLEKEIPRLKDKIKSVQLCFTTDPFMCGYKEIEDMSIQIINMLNDADIKCVILTKGILPKDLVKTSKINEYGITLVSLNENFRKQYEPNTATYDNRINALEYLHDNGFKTWVSIEPYPTPNIFDQDLNEILERISFVDKIIFGRTNYNTEVTKYKNHKQFYNSLAQQVIDFCDSQGISYYIKNKTISK